MKKKIGIFLIRLCKRLDRFGCTFQYLRTVLVPASCFTGKYGKYGDAKFGHRVLQNGLESMKQDVTEDFTLLMEVCLCSGKTCEEASQANRTGNSLKKKTL